MKTAVSIGAQAVHPGYGYLSENPTFAQQIRDAGLIFIGPTPDAMSTLGDKRSSKDYLRKHAPEVPLIPGFEGSSQNVEILEKAAAQIGYPVMLKASAGGGGKGIRIVRAREQLRSELERAKSEASRSFGSSDCILEKYIEEGKHLEIQIMGDSHGNVISLGERDCSVQRRHQKVIEETPCALISPETRRKMSETAALIGRLIGYEGAGTVEFVFDVQKHTYYFLEVNARLQVEHPITEEVLGLDLVALQLFVAAGGELSSLSAVRDVTQTGHAIECRLCAEDPQRDFFPEHGKVLLWQEAEHTSKNVRYETAIVTGAQVSIHFDSMIAKIVVWAPTRLLAVEKMAKVLANTVCAGVRTNQAFLQSCLLHTSFRDPAYTTSFIARNLESLLQNPYVPDVPRIQKLFSLIPAIYLRDHKDDKATHSANKPFSSVRRHFRNQHFDPLGRQSCIVTTIGSLRQSESLAKDATFCMWDNTTTEGSALNLARLGSVAEYTESTVKNTQQSEDSSISMSTNIYNALSNIMRDGTLLSKPAYNVEVNSCRGAHGALGHDPASKAASIIASINGAKVIAHVVCAQSNDTQAGQSARIFCHFPALGTWTEYRYDTLLSYCEGLRQAAGALGGLQNKTVTAPMPCKVLSISKRNGDEVKAGEAVMVVESMKMEMSISVTADGKFETSLKKGDAVDEGKVLCLVV